MTDADICIIGSGPAGSTLVREFAGTGINVVVLESGSLLRQPNSDVLNEVENVGSPRVLDQWLVRNRILGGSSHSWTGRCAPFDEIDYQARSWVPHSGWPFGADEMRPYLDRAASHLGLGVGTGFTDGEFWKLARRTPPSPALDERLLAPFFWQYSRDTRNPYDSMRFGPPLLKLDSRNIRIVTNATVLHINTNPEMSAVSSLEIADGSGRLRTISASIIVLCAGGIENARLLLASNRRDRAGLGNSRDLVGRFLMDHPRGPVAAFDVHGTQRLQSRFGMYSARSSGGSHLFRHGLRLSPEMQEREGLLNCTSWLSEIVTPDDPWHALKRFLRGRAELRADGMMIAKNLGLFVRGLNQYFVERNGIPRKLQGLELDVTVEQRPNPDSRISLSDRMDRHGVPLSRIDWRIDEQEHRTVRRMAELTAQEFNRLGLATPILAPWVKDGGAFPDTFRDVAHPTGTTRMSTDPVKGVVDPECQVHGLAGLYVAGSSVFPTGGHVNPTQMIVALAIRLADTLKQRTFVCPIPSRSLVGVGP